MFSNKTSKTSEATSCVGTKDEVRIKLEQWREEKKKQRMESVLSGPPAPKRFRIGQTPPPVPKSMRKRNPVTSRIDCNWKKKNSIKFDPILSKENKTKSGNHNVNDKKPLNHPSEKRRLTTVLKPLPATVKNTSKTCSNTIWSGIAVKPVGKNSNTSLATKSTITQLVKSKIAKPVSNVNKRTAKTHFKSSRRLSLRSSKSFKNTDRVKTIKQVPAMSKKLSTCDTENIEPDTDTDLAWSLDQLSPKPVTFNYVRQQTPHSKIVTAHKNGKDASIRKTLKTWLESNGKTPSSFRHLMCFDAQVSKMKCNIIPPTKSSITVKELTQQQNTLKNEERHKDIKKNLSEIFDNVDESVDHPPSDDMINQQLLTMLDECFTLFLAGCPVDSILPWLDRIEKSIPQACRSTPFYICKLNVVKRTGSQRQILSVIEDAIKNSAKPADKLAEVITSMMKDMLDWNKQRFETPNKCDIQDVNIFDSMAVKYSVREVTPFTSKNKRKHNSEEGKKFSPRSVVTPVRRSTRKSKSMFENSDTNKVYLSLLEMTEEENQRALYHTNTALEKF